MTATSNTTIFSLQKRTHAIKYSDFIIQFNIVLVTVEHQKTVTRLGLEVVNFQSLYPTCKQ